MAPTVPDVAPGSVIVGVTNVGLANKMIQKDESKSTWQLINLMVKGPLMIKLARTISW